MEALTPESADTCHRSARANQTLSAPNGRGD